MKAYSILCKAGGLLLASGMLLLSGCDILEYLFEEESPSSNPDNSQPPNPQPQPVLVGYNATLEIADFTCYNGEEDDYVTSSGQDEITFIYTILETDQNGWTVRSNYHGWGPYDIFAGEAYNSQYFESLSLSQIPLDHGLVITLNIVEIEDYSEAQSTIDSINEYAEYVKLANTFNPEPYSKTAIEIVGDILYYSGIGLDIVDWADDDDLLADQVDVGNPNLVYSTLLGGGQLYNGWVFSGTNNTDNFEYGVNYIVHLTPIYQ